MVKYIAVFLVSVFISSVSQILLKRVRISRATVYGKNI